MAGYWYQVAHMGIRVTYVKCWASGAHVWSLVIIGYHADVEGYIFGIRQCFSFVGFVLCKD